MSETDEDAARAWFERMQDMREGCEAAVAALARDGTLSSDYSETEATDLLWTLLSLQTWESLVVRCGWDQARYTATVLSMARRALVAGAD